MTAPLVTPSRDLLKSALLAVLMAEYGGDEKDWTGMGSLSRVVAALPVRAADTLAGDGQANTCRHDSATGVDTTSPRDPEKVWRCDHCGLTWRGGDR